MTMTKEELRQMVIETNELNEELQKNNENLIEMFKEQHALYEMQQVEYEKFFTKVLAEFKDYTDEFDMDEFKVLQ